MTTTRTSHTGSMWLPYTTACHTGDGEPKSRLRIRPRYLAHAVAVAAPLVLFGAGVAPVAADPYAPGPMPAPGIDQDPLVLPDGTQVIYSDSPPPLILPDGTQVIYSDSPPASSPGSMPLPPLAVPPLVLPDGTQVIYSDSPPPLILPDGTQVIYSDSALPGGPAPHHP